MQNFKYTFFSAPRLILAGIVLATLFLMLWASFGDSAIMDELAHIPAGYGYVHNLDYRLNPEHPPLIKALAGFPLLFLDLKFPTDSPAWKTDINGQWVMGANFLYESGNDADLIIRTARIAPILLTLILIVLIYMWSAELLGKWWALLPAILFGFSPTVLAHGHYVTTDIGATLGIVLATYFFIKFLLSPSIKFLLTAGAAFGIAQLMKFSAVLLIPYFIIIIFFFFVSTVVRDWNETDAGARLKRFFIRALRHIKSVIIIFAIGYIAVVYPIYFLFTFNEPIQKQTADTESILNSFAGSPTPAGQLCKPTRCLADLDVWLSKNPATRPFAEYLLGVLMVVQRATGGNTSYFLGEVSNSGSPLYFPVVYLLKETLPALIIILTGILLAVSAIVRKLKIGFGRAIKYFFTDYLGTNFAEFSMFVFVVLYWTYSMRSPLNIGVRHLLPTFPFIYILATSAWKRWLYASLSYEAASIFEKIKMFFKSSAKFFLKSVLLSVLAIWFLIETAFATPYFLSYFNQFGGGVNGGYRYVADSNYDWGQDLLRLQAFVENYPEIDPVRSRARAQARPEGAYGRTTSNGIDKIAVDYFGGGNPKYYLGKKEVAWQSSKNSPADKGIYWFAVSVNNLQSAIQPLAPGYNRNPEDEYKWLTDLRSRDKNSGGIPVPDYKAGTSIFIYKLQ